MHVGNLKASSTENKERLSFESVKLPKSGLDILTLKDGGKHDYDCY